ncbi:MAG: aspartate kinase [Cyclobacteriaceae bacterium]|nr:aspartate kinase [Cyclobacteriaceae bacterium HetDA_MAG_MS6]
MKVMKFGGTSVGSAERIKHVATLVEATEGKKFVVLSAVSGTTNVLVKITEHFRKNQVNEATIELAALKDSYQPLVDELFTSEDGKVKGYEIVDRYLGEIKKLITQPYYPQASKVIVVQGELISTNLFYTYLKEQGREVALVPAMDFMSLNQYGEPDMPVITERITGILKERKETTLVTQGFICRNISGGIDNLKRGGSDYSATLIGAAIQAEEVQIWTDIDGMHNNDPRVVEKTQPISKLSFEEAGELAYFGAKILHPNCIIPAQKNKVPVRIKNTMKPDAEGTLITSEQNPTAVKAIAAKDGITAIKIKSSRMIMAYGFMRKVFEVFEKYKTSIDMITTSEIAVSLTIDDPSHLSKIVEELKPYGTVEVDEQQTIICIVGDLVAEHKGVGREIFKALDEITLRMISYGGSRNNISILVDTKYKREALISLNDQLFDF